MQRTGQLWLDDTRICTHSSLRSLRQSRLQDERDRNSLESRRLPDLILPTFR